MRYEIKELGAVVECPKCHSKLRHADKVVVDDEKKKYELKCGGCGYTAPLAVLVLEHEETIEEAVKRGFRGMGPGHE